MDSGHARNKQYRTRITSDYPHGLTGHRKREIELSDQNSAYISIFTVNLLLPRKIRRRVFRRFSERARFSDSQFSPDNRTPGDVYVRVEASCTWGGGIKRIQGRKIVLWPLPLRGSVKWRRVFYGVRVVEYKEFCLFGFLIRRSSYSAFFVDFGLDAFRVKKSAFRITGYFMKINFDGK